MRISQLGNTGTLAGILLLTAAGIAAAAEPRPAPVPSSGVGLGWGWQSAREMAIPSICVEFARGEDLAQTSRLTIREVSDRSELMDSLNVSASVAVDAIGWSANASASFAKSVEMKQTSSTFLLRAEIDDGLIFTAPPAAGGPLRTAPRPVTASPDAGPRSERIGDWLGGLFGRSAPATTSPGTSGGATEARAGGRSQPLGAVRLTARAKSLVTSGKVSEFLKECGDSFVWGIRGGAELNAAITFKTRSLTEKENISAEMSGSYSFVRGTGKFGKDHDASATAENYTLTSVQIGGSRGAIPGSREKLLEKLDGLAREAAERPKPVGLLVASYHDLPDWPAGPLAGEASARDLRLAAYWRYTTLYENIEEVLENQAGFMLNRGVTVASLRALQDQVSAIRRTIENAARAVDVFERTEGAQSQAASVRDLAAAIREAISDEADELETTFRPPTQSLRAVESPAADRLTAALASAESAMVPIEELLTRMPLPYADSTAKVGQKAEDKLTDKKMQEAIVDYYIGRPAKRRCSVAATAPGCLTNAEIEGFVLQVPIGPKDLTRHGNPVGVGSGARFGDVPLYSVLDSQLIRISIHHNVIGIRGLDLTYETPDGREVTVGSGKPTGTTTKTLELGDDERLREITGLWLPINERRIDARHVLSLTFTTTKNAKLTHAGLFAEQGPIRAAGKAFAFRPEAGEEIFSLSGRMHPLLSRTTKSPEYLLLGQLEPVYRKITPP